MRVSRFENERGGSNPPGLSRKGNEARDTKTEEEDIDPPIFYVHAFLWDFDHRVQKSIFFHKSISK